MKKENKEVIEESLDSMILQIKNQIKKEISTIRRANLELKHSRKIKAIFEHQLEHVLEAKKWWSKEEK